MKTVKLRLDNVLARQLEELSGMLNLTLPEYCQLCVIQKSAEIRDAFKKAADEIQKDSRAEEAL